MLQDKPNKEEVERQLKLLRGRIESAMKKMVATGGEGGGGGDSIGGNWNNESMNLMLVKSLAQGNGGAKTPLKKVLWLQLQSEICSTPLLALPLPVSRRFPAKLGRRREASAEASY